MSVSLTNLDKLLWKKEKISKGDLIEYYAAISRTILPYLKARPLVMHRFPDGITGESFYQKEAGKVPSFVKTHLVKKVNYILVDNAKTLLYVANLASIELHPFHSRVKNLEKPDYLIFDLDPESISFDAVVETAQVIHDQLEKIHMPNFCKTSGGDGLHIYVPLKGKYTYPQVKEFAMGVAALVHEELPEITSLERLPRKRQKKVYIDTLQNEHGQTVVAPYSVRGRPGATVSTPLEWKEVKPGLDPTQFTLRTTLKRLAKKGDLFKGMLKMRR